MSGQLLKLTAALICMVAIFLLITHRRFETPEDQGNSVALKHSFSPSSSHSQNSSETTVNSALSPSFHHETIHDVIHEELKSEHKEIIKKHKANPALNDIKKEREYLKQHHEFVSPRPGANIAPSNQNNLLHCPNQSTCITPQLQLKIKLRIYLCKHPIKSGVRFYYLVREGLLLHPNVELVHENEMEDADYIVYLPGSAPWHKSECNATSHRIQKDKFIVLDEFDGPSPPYEPYPTEKQMIRHYGESKVWYFMYFKRSFVIRRDGLFRRYHLLSETMKPDMYPITYSLAESYLPHNFQFNRETEIMCTLRGHKGMPTRLRAQEWVAEYVNLHKIKNFVKEALSSAQRNVISEPYFNQMRNSTIIITVNPSEWEGDFRLWESLSSGALVFVDPLFVPHPFPLVDGYNVVFFSNNNRTELFSKLDYYRSNPNIAKKVAHQGYLHAMKYHRAVNMIDYVLRSSHLKRATLKGVKIPKYYYTGQYLNYEARRQEKEIKNNHLPGSYTTKTMFNHTHLLEK